jgi:hypothetical protein
MDGVNAREKEKTIVQNLLNLAGVKGAISHPLYYTSTDFKI